MSDIRLRLAGFDGDNVIINIHGDSKYNRRHLYFSPTDFLEFLKYIHNKRMDVLIEIPSDSYIEDHKKFLR